MDNDASNSSYIEAASGLGRLHVVLRLFNTGDGWVGSLTGGDKPHVGGVTLAVPRPSLTGSGADSCDMYCIPIPGHLDNEVAMPVARKLCMVLKKTISLSSGIHIDGAQPDELSAIRDNCIVAVDIFELKRAACMAMHHDSAETM